ncbi:50S ribosomal protein L11 [Candidatus Woesearchaeota archaeon]|nr:50S ribosomal protein L11 [Candidatus Woesearchaeota archaeon]
MGKQTVEALVEGGKATAAPPLGPALGPMGVNIGQVVAKINEKTASFKGMQVPVKVIIDSDTKEFDVTVGTPPATALLKKEAGVDKGAANPLQDKVADIVIEQAMKIAKMKEDALLGKTLKEKVLEVCGTCQSMGILVQGKPANETIADIHSGKYDEKIASGKTELTEEEKKKLEEERKRLAEEIEKRRHEFEAKAKQILEEMKGKERGEIKKKMHEAEIPEMIIKEMMPAEEEKKEEAGEKKEEKKAEPKEKK